MQPAMSALIREELYPKLQDGANVFEYPPVSGLAALLSIVEPMSSMQCLQASRGAAAF